MPRKTNTWVVRVKMEKHYKDDLRTITMLCNFVESLRYAGLVSIAEQTEEYIILDIPCPFRDVNVHQWASMNAERMRTFGLNALPVEKY